MSMYIKIYNNININIKKCVCGEDIGFKRIKYCDECSKKHCHNWIKPKKPCKRCGNKIGKFKYVFCSRKCNDSYDSNNKRIKRMVNNA